MRAPLEKAEFSSPQIERIAAVQPYVFRAARKHSLEPELIMGVIWVESRFQIRAKSPAGARGLMQLMPKTAAELAKQMGEGRARFYDPSFNVMAGSFYLAKLIKWFDGDLHLALAAYHAGPGNVKKWTARGKHLLPRMSHRYIGSVLTARSRFRLAEASPIRKFYSSKNPDRKNPAPKNSQPVRIPPSPKQERSLFIVHPELDSGRPDSQPWTSHRGKSSKQKKLRPDRSTPSHQPTPEHNTQSPIILPDVNS